MSARVLPAEHTPQHPDWREDRIVDMSVAPLPDARDPLLTLPRGEVEPR
ncbi:hypothetical protein ACTU3I_11705 [Microbacterium sp. RD1]